LCLVHVCSCAPIPGTRLIDVFMLYLIPTPIGNLGDITLRALETLKSVDVIAAEDTRETGKLLKHFGIGKPLFSFHEHSADTKRRDLLARLEQGETVALVSEAGTPLVSDPGYKLVREALRRGVRVEALPGAAAFVTALVASGAPPDRFAFFGFLPPKTGARQRRLAELAAYPETLIFYESPHRLLKMLADVRAVLGERSVAVARELTKKFEEIKRGKVSEVMDAFGRSGVRGEIVVIVWGKDKEEA